MSPHQSKPDSHAFVLLHVSFSSSRPLSHCHHPDLHCRFPPQIAEPMATMVSSLMAAHIAVFLALMLLMLGGTEAKFMSNNITVVGSVYCDACSNNTFSKHSFFLKGQWKLLPVDIDFDHSLGIWSRKIAISECVREAESIFACFLIPCSLFCRFTRFPCWINNATFKIF